MHHEINKGLYNAYPLNEKSEFFAGYLYMKYAEHFAYVTAKSLGLECEPPAEKIDDAIMEMIEMLVQQIADSGADRKTSIYHAKVLSLENAKKLVTQKEDLHLTPSEKIIPFEIARDIILESPESISVGTCPCRAISKNPCLPPPMEVCLWPGEPNASFIAGQNIKFRKITQDEAVRILEDCHEKGFVHCAYFEKSAANRMDVICNCCSCCCLGIKMFNLLDMGHDNPFLAASGYVAEIQEECTGCGTCVDVCHFKALSLDPDEGKAVVSFERCMGCGVCESKCPEEAIRLKREPVKGDPLDIDEIKKDQL